MSNTQALLSFRLKEYVRRARLNYQALKALDDIPNYHKAEGEQTCSNCYFFQAGNCTKFKAKVKPSYTCDEWKGEIEKKEVSPPPSTVMAHGVSGLFSDSALETSKKKKKQVITAKEASLTPPQAARNAAKKALEWRDKYGKQVKAMTPVGWTRARQLASGKPVSMDTVRRMAQFNRHRKNAVVNEKYKNEPWRDNGHVAWLGWGGTSGIDWAISQVKKANDKPESTKEAESDNLLVTEKHLQGKHNQKKHGFRFNAFPSLDKAREYRKAGVLQDYMKKAKTVLHNPTTGERGSTDTLGEAKKLVYGIEYAFRKVDKQWADLVHNPSTDLGKQKRQYLSLLKQRSDLLKQRNQILDRFELGGYGRDWVEYGLLEAHQDFDRNIEPRYKEVTHKPGGKSPGASIKNPRVYEALRKKGMSKRIAAAISNAQVVTKTTKATTAVIDKPNQPVPATPQTTKDPLHIAVGKSLGQFGVVATVDAYGAGPEEHGSAWKAPIASLQVIQTALAKAGYKQSGGKFKKNSVLIDTGKDTKSLYLYITDDNGTAKKGMKEFVRTLRTNSNVYSI